MLLLKLWSNRFFFLGLDLYLTVLCRSRNDTGAAVLSIFFFLLVFFFFFFPLHLIQHIVQNLNSSWLKYMNLMSHLPTVSSVFGHLLAGKGVVCLTPSG